LTKPFADDVLLGALEHAIERSRTARDHEADVRALRDRHAALTPREREVFQHVVAGQPNKQIAADLGTVEKTIKVHRSRVMEKMGVRSLADLVRMAERIGPTAITASPGSRTPDTPLR